VEIEAKFAVIGPLDPPHIDTLDLAPYRLVPRGVQRHHDEVLDTPARSLTAARRSLRIRRAGQEAVLTLKGPNTTSDDGMYAREEIEASLPEGTDGDIRAWPPQIAERVAPLIGGQPLAPLVRVDVTRRLWDVIRAGRRVAELALDSGEIAANGRRQPLYELEVELKGAGKRADLDALAGRLQNSLPLRAEPRSKLQRGLALLDEAERAGATAVAEVGRRAIVAQLDRLKMAETAARGGQDAEGVHDMRVAVRRLRTMLDVLAASPDLDGRKLRKLRRALKPLAQALGGVRDLDVLLERLAAYEASQPDLSAGLAAFRAWLEHRRARAHARLVAYLDGGRLSEIFVKLEEMIGSLQETDKGNSVTVAQFAGSAAWSRYEAMLRGGGAVAARDPVGLHHLRIACKRLRYTLELFAEELGPVCEPLLDTLKHGQDTLGTLHDAVVERDLLAKMCAKRAGSETLAIYDAALAAERDECIAAFGREWPRLSGAAFRRPLADLIGAL
jgi:inorganic triphosphatase YgiF